MSDSHDAHGSDLPHVIVIGDGHAGVAAAVMLADQGHRVTIVESAVHVGESSTSHIATDNCQHAMMRMCTNQCDLYRRLGVIRDIDWHKTLYFTGEDGIIDELTGDDLPAPFHLTRSLLKMKRFPWGEKIAIFRGLLSVMQVSAKARENLSGESFRDWLLSAGQPEHVVDKFWAAVIAGACNQLPRDISAAYGVRILQEGFLYSNTGYQIGFSKINRLEFHEKAFEIVKKAGGNLEEGVHVDRIEYDASGKSVSGVHLSDGRTLSADAYITAVPHARLAELSCDEMIADDDRLSMIENVEKVPVIGVHFFLDSPDHHDVMVRDHLIFTDGPIRWVFNKGHEAYGDHADTHHVHAVLGHAKDYAHLSDDEIIEQCFHEMRLCMPSLTEDVSVVIAHVVREARAASSPRPGGKQSRPKPAGTISNLFVAGDWASTGWPTSREGAVRSGYRAASAVTQMDVPHTQMKYNKLLVPDVESSNLYAAMSG